MIKKCDGDITTYFYLFSGFPQCFDKQSWHLKAAMANPISLKINPSSPFAVTWIQERVLISANPRRASMFNLNG